MKNVIKLHSIYKFKFQLNNAFHNNMLSEYLNTIYKYDIIVID